MFGGCCQIRGFSSSPSLRSILAGDGEFLVSTRVLSLVLAFVWLLRTLFSHSFGTCHRHAFSSSSSSLDKVLYQFLSSFSLVYPCVQFLLLRSISHCIRVCWLDFFLFIFFYLSSNLKILFTLRLQILLLLVDLLWSENFHSHWSSPMIPKFLFPVVVVGIFCSSKKLRQNKFGGLGYCCSAASSSSTCYHATFFWGGVAGGERIPCLLLFGGEKTSVFLAIICVLVFSLFN